MEKEVVVNWYLSHFLSIRSYQILLKVYNCLLDYGEGLRHLNRQEDWLKTAVISKNRILSKTECRWHCLYIDNIDANEFQLTICHDKLVSIDAKVQKHAYGFVGTGNVL